MTDDCDSDVIDAEEDPVCDCANKAHKRSCILNPKNLGQKHGARTVDAAVMGAALDKVIFKKRWLDIPLIRIAPSKLLTPVGPSASVSDDTFMPPRQLDLTPICPPELKRLLQQLFQAILLPFQVAIFCLSAAVRRPRLFLTVFLLQKCLKV